MGVSHIAVIAAISLSGLVPSSCSKVFSARGAAKHVADTNAPFANPGALVDRQSNIKNLGEVAMINGHETHVNVGEGRSFTITPRLIGRDSVRLTMALKSEQADGKTAGLIVTQVSTRLGQPFEVAIGDMDITITPQMAKE